MARYESAHASPSGPGDARPTAHQIITDESLDNKLSNKVVLITGCSSGIGVETARAIHRTGATIYATARDVSKAKTALSDIASSPKVHFLQLDLNSLDSVRRCTSEFKAASNQLNILVLNAGVMACPEGRTEDGYETQFGVNHLAHFLLFHLLQPVLIASSTPEFHTRVVAVSSSGHRVAAPKFNNINLEGEYNPWAAYGQSKTANIWMANEIERKYASLGLHGISIHPGLVGTELGRHLPEESFTELIQSDFAAKNLKTIEQGAATSVIAAVGAEFEGKGGIYLENCQIAKPYTGPWIDTTGRDAGYGAWAYSLEGEKKLWEFSLELLGLN